MRPNDDLTATDHTTEDEVASDADSDSSHRAQLYLFPAVIVLVFIFGWLFVFWLLHENQDAHSLVQGMQRPGRRSWQNAYALSQLLRDPDHDHLKDDQQLCRVLTESLLEQNEVAARDQAAGRAEDDELIVFRAFLCRAIGEFRVRDGLPALLDCAATDTTRLPAGSREGEVRLAALEAIALLAENVGSREILSEPRAIELLLDASRDNGVASATGSPSDIASAATFALGVLGGSQATEQLIELLRDERSDVRYNAAAGLTRHGRAEAVPVLLEMLNPENRTAYEQEKTAAAQTRKQAMILGTAIRAAERLLPELSLEHRQLLISALAQLSDSTTVAARVRVDAKQALLKSSHGQ